MGTPATRRGACEPDQDGVACWPLLHGACDPENSDLAAWRRKTLLGVVRMHLVYWTGAQPASAPVSCTPGRLPAAFIGPGNPHSRAACGTPCSSRRSASLLRPLGALGFGPTGRTRLQSPQTPSLGPEPAAASGTEAHRRQWDWSLPPAVREKGRRNVGNHKERRKPRLCEFPGSLTLAGTGVEPQTGFGAMAPKKQPEKTQSQSRLRSSLRLRRVLSVKQEFRRELV